MSSEIKLCRNCDNAYLYQDCLYCDEIEEETEIEPNDTCSLWKLRESSVTTEQSSIVHCKDCRWHKDYDGCFFSTAECEPEHFCSWGERQSADETLREICRDFIGIVEETMKDND